MSLPPAGRIYDVMIEHTGGWRQKTGLDHLHRDKRILDAYLAQNKIWALAYEAFARVCKYEGLKERGPAAMARPEYSALQRAERAKGQAYADLMARHPLSPTPPGLSRPAVLLVDEADPVDLGEFRGLGRFGRSITIAPGIPVAGDLWSVREHLGVDQSA